MKLCTTLIRNYWLELFLEPLADRVEKNLERAWRASRFCNALQTTVKECFRRFFQFGISFHNSDDTGLSW